MTFKTFSLSGKVNDLGYYQFIDEHGDVFAAHDGYCPCGGDYIELDIDVETGRVLNWPIWKEALAEFLEEKGV